MTSCLRTPSTRTRSRPSSGRRRWTSGDQRRPHPEFQFDAPEEHREYFRQIALVMVARHGVSYEEAAHVTSRPWGEQDQFGEYNWLIFHEDPENWVDHMHRHQLEPEFWAD